MVITPGSALDRAVSAILEGEPIGDLLVEIHDEPKVVSASDRLADKIAALRESMARWSGWLDSNRKIVTEEAFEMYARFPVTTFPSFRALYAEDVAVPTHANYGGLMNDKVRALAETLKGLYGAATSSNVVFKKLVEGSEEVVDADLWKAAKHLNEDLVEDLGRARDLVEEFLNHTAPDTHISQLAQMCDKLISTVPEFRLAVGLVAHLASR